MVSGCAIGRQVFLPETEGAPFEARFERGKRFGSPKQAGNRLTAELRNRSRNPASRP